MSAAGMDVAGCREKVIHVPFFFNVRDGRNVPDDKGMEFTDWHAARQHAIRYAGKLLDNEGDRLALGEDWCMEVCDETDLVLFRLDFSVSLAPVLSEGLE